MLSGCGADASIEAAATPAATSAAKPATTETPTVDDAAGSLTPAKTLENLLNAALAADAAKVMDIRLMVSDASTEDEFRLASGYLTQVIPELQSMLIFLPDEAALAQQAASRYRAYFVFLGLTEMANDTDLTIEVPESSVTISGETASVDPTTFIYSGVDVAAMNNVEQLIYGIESFSLSSMDGTWHVSSAR